MTLHEFNQLRHAVKTLPPEQMRQLRDDIDRELAQPVPHAEEQPTTPPQMTREAFHRHLMEIGLIARLPDPAEDLDDDEPDDQPIVIEGEPLSETIIRERR